MILHCHFKEFRGTAPDRVLSQVVIWYILQVFMNVKFVSYNDNPMDQVNKVSRLSFDISDQSIETICRLVRNDVFLDWQGQLFKYRLWFLLRMEQLKWHVVVLVI